MFIPQGFLSVKIAKAIFLYLDLPPKPQTVKRKIGKAACELSLYFIQASTECMSDKVMRLQESNLSAKK